MFGLVMASLALAVAPGVAAGASGSHGTVLVGGFNATTNPGISRLFVFDVASGAKRPVLQGKGILPSGAAWSPDGRWIAVAKGNAVELVGGDGRGLRLLPQMSAPLARVGSLFSSFGWAPDSRSLAISEAGGHRLVIRGIEGGARVIRRTGTNVAMLNVSWSPDGRWISYNRENRGGENGSGCCSLSLHLVHPDGSDDHTVIVMHQPLHDSPSTAAWSRGGHRFAFTTAADDPRDPPLALVDTSSGRITALPLDAYLIGWSTTGSELATVKRSRNGGPSSVSLIDVSKQSHTLKTTLPPFPLAGAWSSDGTKLVISGAETSTDRPGLVDVELIDANGGPPRVLTQLPRGFEVQVLAWRPKTRAR